MTLFEQLVRTEARPRRQNESSFEYLNTSARPGICAIRDLLETWFDHLPYGAQADISGRLRSREDVQHKSAFFELFWHELLRSGGYEVEIHPSMDDVVTNPDFLARRYGVSQFYLETTLAMPPGDAAADRRLATLHGHLGPYGFPRLFS